MALSGIEFDPVTEAEVSDVILDGLGEGVGGTVVTANLDHLVLLRDDADMLRVYRAASLVVADGQPIVWASRVAGSPLPERVAGSMLISSLSERCADAGVSIALVGGGSGVAEQCSAELVRRFAGLEIALVAAPSVSDGPTDDEVANLADAVARSDASVIFLAFGTPKQEVLGAALAERMPERWFIGIGGAFDMVAGHRRQASPSIQRAGLEWAFRLVQDPRRLAHRYLRQDLPEVPGLFAEAVARRVVRRRADRY